MKYLLAALLLIGFSFSAPAADAPTKKKAAPKEEVPSAESQAAAKSLTPTQKTKLMDIINNGDEKALTSLPGIGPGRAKNIVKARPVAEPIDLLKVEGIGDATFASIVAHAKADFPVKEKKKTPAKPKGEEPKKKAPEKKKPEEATDKKAATE